MQNFHSNKDLLDEIFKRMRTKIAKLDGLIGRPKNEGQQISKDQIIALVKQQVKHVLQSYEILLKKISKFSQIEYCNSIDCLKHQLASLNAQVIEQNEGIKNVSKTFASQFDKALFLVKEVQCEIPKLKTTLDRALNVLSSNFQITITKFRVESSILKAPLDTATSVNPTKIRYYCISAVVLKRMQVEARNISN